MEVTRQMMLAAREAYEARYDGTRIETLIRHAASSLELSAALNAVEEPRRTVALAAGILPDDEEPLTRLGVILLVYPYARHCIDENFDFGQYVHRYAPRVRRSFAALLGEVVPERTTFVRVLRAILIRTKRHHTPVDWAALGTDILRWDQATKTQWARGCMRRAGEARKPQVRVPAACEEDCPESSTRPAVDLSRHVAMRRNTMTSSG